MKCRGLPPDAALPLPTAAEEQGQPFAALQELCTASGPPFMETLTVTTEAKPKRFTSFAPSKQASLEAAARAGSARAIAKLAAQSQAGGEA